MASKELQKVKYCFLEKDHKGDHNPDSSICIDAEKSYEICRLEFDRLNDFDDNYEIIEHNRDYRIIKMHTTHPAPDVDKEYIMLYITGYYGYRGDIYDAYEKIYHINGFDDPRIPEMIKEAKEACKKAKEEYWNGK